MVRNRRRRDLSGAVSPWRGADRALAAGGASRNRGLRGALLRGCLALRRPHTRVASHGLVGRGDSLDFLADRLAADHCAGGRPCGRWRDDPFRFNGGAVFVGSPTRAPWAAAATMTQRGLGTSQLVLVSVEIGAMRRTLFGRIQC